MGEKLGRHTRENQSLLAVPERRLLTWVARRLPNRVNSDHLTTLGFAGMVMTGVAFGLSQWNESFLILVVPLLVLNWFGDSMDGTLARVRHCQRPRYGYYIDHILDVFGTSILLVGLAVSGYMTPLIAFGFLVAFLVLTAEIFLATHSVGRFQMSYSIFGPTETRILLGIGSLQLLCNPLVTIGPWGTFHLFDVGGIVGIAACLIAVMVSAARNAAWLYQLNG